MQVCTSAFTQMILTLSERMASSTVYTEVLQKVDVILFQKISPSLSCSLSPSLSCPLSLSKGFTLHSS